MKNIFHLEQNPHRIYGLDILRALAIIFVMLNHGSEFLFGSLSDISWYVQHDGVSIFFVLSGFLIGGILIKTIETKGFGLKVMYNFWIRRWFRTLPTYFLILSILAFLYLNFTSYFTLGEILPYYIFSQNLVSPHPKFFPEAWSLSVEEWFYVLVPLILFVNYTTFKLKTKSSLFLVAILLIVGVTFFRYYKFINLEVVNNTILLEQFGKQVFTRLDSIMYGVVGVILLRYQEKFFISNKNLLFFVGICLFVFSKSEVAFFELGQMYQAVFSYSVFAFAILCTLPFFYDMKKGIGNISKIVSVISMTSYSMYLLNLSIFTFVEKTFIQMDIQSTHGVSLVKYFMFWFLTIIASILLYKYFERPTMELRDRFSEG